MNPRFARVLVDGTTDREFDYLVPGSLAESVLVGTRVRIPFRHRQLVGTVVALPAESGVDASKLRPLAEVVGRGAEPAIPAVLLELDYWVLMPR